MPLRHYYEAYWAEAVTCHYLAARARPHFLNTRQAVEMSY